MSCTWKAPLIISERIVSWKTSENTNSCDKTTDMNKRQKRNRIDLCRCAHWRCVRKQKGPEVEGELHGPMSAYPLTSVIGTSFSVCEFLSLISYCWRFKQVHGEKVRKSEWRKCDVDEDSPNQVLQWTIGFKISCHTIRLDRENMPQLVLKLLN